MFAVTLSFRLPAKQQAVAARKGPYLDQELSLLILALVENGQLSDTDRTTIQRGRTVQVLALAPERESLTSVRPSRRVRAGLRSLRRHGVEFRAPQVLGEVAESVPICTCRHPTALILTTHFLTVESPLRCGACAGVVPFYRYPPPDGGDCYGQGMRWWTQQYRCFDLLWIGSSVCEKLAYRELSRHDSKLSRTGRNECREIERRAGVPVYYALFRYSGVSLASERRRRCPDCGDAWLLDEPWLKRFQFRCGRCRLVSNIADDLRR